MDKFYNIETIIKGVSVRRLFDNLPAFVTRQKSLEYWNNYDFLRNDNRAFIFTQMYIVKANFPLPDYRLKDIVFICEKTIGRYRKEYKRILTRDYEYYKNLPFEQLYTVYLATDFSLHRLQSADNA